MELLQELNELAHAKYLELFVAYIKHSNILVGVINIVLILCKILCTWKFLKEYFRVLLCEEITYLIQ